MIFYDKLLDQYSIHHYNLELASEDYQFIQRLKPVLLDSKQLIEKIGVRDTINLIKGYSISDRDGQVYLAMRRVVKPLLVNRKSRHID